MAKLRIALVGATGRMGQEILSLAADDKRLEVTAGVARGESSSPSKSRLKLYEKISELPAKGVDVVIDFSLPELTSSVCDWCAKNGVPLVSGVTGLKPEQHKKLKAAAAKTAVFWSPNMSLGIAVMAEVFSSLAKLEGFQFQIEEAHHKHKKDKPSGTALFLQEKLQEAVGQKLPEPLALRGGGIFGIHKAWAMGDDEVITVEHSAMNRKVFARGALQAAVWLKGRPEGLYSMSDLLR